MAFGFPFNIENIDFLRISVGIFITLITFGVLQKAKILGKSRIINLVVALIIALLLARNEKLVQLVLNFSSNISVLLILGLVFVMIMALTNASSLTLAMLGLFVVLVLIGLNVYPFVLIRAYLPDIWIKVLIALFVVIMVILWATRKK